MNNNLSSAHQGWSFPPMGWGDSKTKLSPHASGSWGDSEKLSPHPLTGWGESGNSLSPQDGGTVESDFPPMVGGQLNLRQQCP